MMKKAAFIFGYAGGIIALVFSLIMIYTVPAGILSNTVEDIKFNMNNDNVLAFNEVALALRSGSVTGYSEGAMTAFAEEVAKNSQVIQDKHVYNKTVAFVYKTMINGAISLTLAALSIVFALIAFIGALICRKAPTGGGVMMLLSALVLLLCAISTNTVIPMVVASALLTVAGIVIFIHVPQKAYRERGHTRGLPQRHEFAQYAPNQPMQYQPSYPQQPYTQAAYAPAKDVRQTNLPFPDVEPQVLSQSAQDDNIKE